MNNSYNKYRKGDTWNGRRYKFPFDLTGVSILCQFKKEPNGVAVFEYNTNDQSIFINNAIDGEIIFNKRKMDYPVGDYFYDLELTFPNGDVRTYGESKLVIFQDISR
jgi:hypothetical protein